MEKEGGKRIKKKGRVRDRKRWREKGGKIGRVKDEWKIGWEKVNESGKG